MKKYLIFVLLILPSYCYALMNPYMFGITTDSGGDVTPDISINMDTGNADCGEVGWTGEYVTDPNSDMDCDTTTHRDGASGYSARADNGGPAGAYISFDGAKTELWIEFYMYIDDTDSTWDVTVRYASIRNSSATTAIFFHVRDNSGYKQGYNAGSNQYGTGTVDPDQDTWIRIHVVKSDTVGVVEIWDSLNGSSYTQRVDVSSADTNQGVDWERFMVGYNEGNGLSYDWYFDTVKIWYTDPGWE